MLTINVREIARLVLINVLVFELPAVVSAQGFPSSASAPSQEKAASQPMGQTQVGAPQVLEIPPIQESPLPTPNNTNNVPATPRTSYMGGIQVDDLSQDNYAPQVNMRRTYLGLRYVSSEEEGGGVMVIDTLADSPAARAGFIGEKSEIPATGAEKIMKVAIAALVMTPAAPAVIPLAVAHQMFLTCHPRGDVIVAIGDRLIRDAQDFNDEMRRYRPGDQVAFSIKRCGKPLQLSVQLEDEPQESFSGRRESDLPTLSSEHGGFDLRTSGTNFPP